MRPVTVQFLKNPDVIHWGFSARFLGVDEYGTWLAAPVGTKRWKGDVVHRPTTEPAVFCAPHEGWWHLHYSGARSRYSHFVDIATPAVWVSENRYEMIDLDLDVAIHQDGTIDVQDADEFEVHQVEYRYSKEMIARAVEEKDRVVAALTRRDEPFFEVAANWLSRLGE